MKVMILTKLSEAPDDMVPPSQEAILAMHNYNEALIAAGILKDQVYGGLMPSKFAKRLHYTGKNLTVTDGPFTETKEVVAGFALWEVKDFDEALECHEDYELGLRLIAAGARLRYVSEAAGWHHEHTTLEGALRRKRDEGRADVVLAGRHPDLAPVLPLSAPLVYHRAASARSALTPRPRSWR